MRNLAKWRDADGVLAPTEITSAQAEGVVLAFDPLRIGWVPATADTMPDQAPLSWSARPDSLAAAPDAAPDPGITFRPWTAADLPVYRAMMSDAQMWRHMPEAAPEDLTDEVLLTLIALSADAPHHRVHSILQHGEPVGQVRLEFSADGRTAELSYWLGPAARGKGLGRRAVRQYLAQPPRELTRIDALFARVHPDNTASARVLAACGFTPTDRAASGLGPRGRDDGSWPVFRRVLA
ncbi:MAG: GNAT family N-acetyltransferase [Rubellimicrobium sp.]|nr:GNAT family N-acetyltransferase [Rubellimicrobium sp.]